MPDRFSRTVVCPANVDRSVLQDVFLYFGFKNKKRNIKEQPSHESSPFDLKRRRRNHHSSLNMPFAPELRSHSQKVCTLYKKGLRQVEAYYVARNVVRYHQVILRNEFDKNRCVCDPKEQRRLLWVGENELFSLMNPIPCSKFATSIGLAGGVAYERELVIPDWVLDYWHPLEKAQYPEYFRKRELRKAEFVKLYESKVLC